MSADDVTEAILQQLRQSEHVIDDVKLRWREAHARARIAYEQWCLSRGEPAYARYRAAQDQADTAQDALHAHHARAVG
jgi:hypothetical protein